MRGTLIRDLRVAMVSSLEKMKSNKKCFKGGRAPLIVQHVKKGLSPLNSMKKVQSTTPWNIFLSLCITLRLHPISIWIVLFQHSIEARRMVTKGSVMATKGETAITAQQT